MSREDNAWILVVGSVPAWPTVKEKVADALQASFAVAPDLARAWRCLKDRQPDLMPVVDNLPDGSGRELLPGDPTRATAPILFLAEEESAASAQGVLNKGAYDYLPLTTAPETLAHLMVHAIRQWPIIQATQSHRAEQYESEKLDAIGQLSGGIAHDFNNQLAVISGFAEILLLKLPRDDDRRKYAKHILQACTRCNTMTQQLLAFGRRGNYRVVPLNVRQLLEAVISWLQHSSEQTITVHRDFDAGNQSTLGDPDQLHDVFLNLVRNARDALPTGGDIWLTTRPLQLEQADITDSPFDLSPGPYIEVMIADNGHGMDAETRRRAFEPFFTTRPKGAGRGMGLAAAYGAILNHHGAIELDSHLHEGTTVRVLLPQSDTTEPAEVKTIDLQPAKSKLDILVVDDEEPVAQACAEMLQLLGHEAIVCHDGETALARYRERQDEIDLVILDMVMPSLSGAQTFLALKEQDADVNVLISSGYSMSEDIQNTLKAGALGLIQKPYTLEALSRRLEALTGNSSHG